MPIRLLALLISGLCVTTSFATPNITTEHQHELASQRFWLSLGHYAPGKLGGWRSYVNDAKFFLADNGDKSPLAELKATLSGLYADPALGDDHPQCRYPARTRWLRKQLTLENLPEPACTEYQIWYNDIDPHSTVLVFPDAYLNSPSSMFGHTLLRIDTPDTQDNGTTLLSYALNFGAMVDNLDNGILYAWRGLAGGYPGQFSLLPYRDKISEYSHLENRDLWEYHLNLTPAETQRMIEHVWELRQIRFDYYFFDENCSFRLLELLEIARPTLSLTEQFPLTAIPVDTVRAVREAGLITEVQYRPSRERELLERLELLSGPELDWVQLLAEDSNHLDAETFLNQPAERQALIQEAAYRWTRYQASGLERDSANAQRSLALLQAINRNPAPSQPAKVPTLPEQGHDSRTWHLGLGSHAHQHFAEYGLRMAYHDLIDNQAGFPLGAQIELGKLRVRQYQGNHWQLEELGLINIRSLTPRNQLLKPWSWQVAAGMERIPTDNDRRRLAGYLSGGGGFTWQPFSNMSSYLLATLRTEHNPDTAAALNLASGFDAGVLWRNPLGNLHLNATTDYFHHGEVRRRLALGQQWELDRNLGLRLSAEREFSHFSTPQNSLILQLRWYHY